ncbi:hypothetical protein MASR2M48_22050 [Spirochaetota bacterium]
MDASGLEAQGRVRELLGQERDDYRAMFLARRPDMASFADAILSASCALKLSAMTWWTTSSTCSF